MMEKMRNRKKKKGFTLIELIVVIAILGILAAIAIPRLGAFRDDANQSAKEANWRTVDSAVQMYIASEEAPTAAGDVDLSRYLNDTTLTLRKPGTTSDIAFTGTVTLNPDGSWVAK